MSADLEKQLDEVERKRKRQEFYLTVRDISIAIILVSAVVGMLYYIATRGGYVS